MDSGQIGNFAGRVAGLVPGAPRINFGIRDNCLNLNWLQITGMDKTMQCLSWVRGHPARIFKDLRARRPRTQGFCNYLKLYVFFHHLIRFFTFYAGGTPTFPCLAGEDARASKSTLEQNVQTPGASRLEAACPCRSKSLKLRALPFSRFARLISPVIRNES